MTEHKVKFKALICTRSGSMNKTKQDLLSYLSRAEVEVKLLIDKNSIFEAYADGFNSLNVEDDDVVILCHDDLEILSDPIHFRKCMSYLTMDTNTGFIGVAGTQKLTEDCIWWNQKVWQEGLHRGLVYHGYNLFNMKSTFYGNHGPVVVMDGLFLAATGRTLRAINFDKGTPHYLEVRNDDITEDGSKWDFYDLHYTMSAHKKGLTNYVVPIHIRHESHGELVGRVGWNQNRSKFHDNWDMYRGPVTIRNFNKETK